MTEASRDDLLKLARERLYPSLTNPNYLVLRSRRLIFQKWIAALKGKPLTILDIGGRYQPYRPLFGDGHRYIACDIVKTELVDVIANGEFLPFAEEVFDAVISTQVFEYFSDPQGAAREVHRVLKPGGAFLMSVAAFAPRFVDEERWRFTASGVRSLLSGFGTVTVVPETSSIGGLSRAINLAFFNFAHFRLIRKMHELTFCPCLNLMGLAAERMRFTQNDQFAPNYSVLAVK
jgi:SAM-dependent methyltransferase